MVTPLAFWEAYRKALVRPGYIWGCGSTFYTSWTCIAACTACCELGLRPRTERGCDVRGYRIDAIGTGVAYEHEGGCGCWTTELCDLYNIDAELRVLVGYYGRDVSALRSTLQEQINRLRNSKPAGTNWLFIFGLDNSDIDHTEPWSVWTLAADGLIVPVAGATEFRPRQDLVVNANC